MRIVIQLPADRRQLGVLRLLDASGKALLSAHCLGLADRAAATAHGNPSRDPLKPFGDTPLGEYKCIVNFHPETVAATIHSFGPYGWIDLIPTAGPALQSAHNGRAGLRIHSGDPNPAYAQWNGLRPTYGCVRIPDADMLALMRGVKDGSGLTASIEQA